MKNDLLPGELIELQEEVSFILGRIRALEVFIQAALPMSEAPRWMCRRWLRDGGILRAELEKRRNLQENSAVVDG